MISVASTRKLFYSTRRICHEENKSECFSELASVSVAGVPDHAASNLIVYSLPLAAGRISRHLLPRTRQPRQKNNCCTHQTNAILSNASVIEALWVSFFRYCITNDVASMQSRTTIFLQQTTNADHSLSS